MANARHNESLSRLFQYHPNRFFALRDDPDWATAATQLHAAQQHDRAFNLISVASVVHGQFLDGQDMLNRDELATFDPARIAAAFDSNHDNSLDVESAMLAWLDAGRQIFDLSPIAPLFLGSDATHVPVQALRFRYPAFYLHWGAQVRLASPDPHRYVDGCYVTVRQRDPAAPPELDLTFTCTLPSGYPWQAASLLANLVTDAEGVEEFSLVPQDSDDHTFGSVLHDLQHGSYEPEAARWLPYLPALLSMVANALCYLCADDAEVHTTYPAAAPERLVRQTTSHRPVQQRNAASKLEALGYHRVHLCGRELARRARVDQFVEGREMPTHWRTGHWRHARVGKGRTDIKLTWIDGVVVNADKGDPVTGHIYLP